MEKWDGIYKYEKLEGLINLCFFLNSMGCFDWVFWILGSVGMDEDWSDEGMD